MSTEDGRLSAACAVIVSEIDTPDSSYQEEHFKEIADAIRTKEGSEEPIVALDFAKRILALEVGGGGSGMPEGLRQIKLLASDGNMGIVSGGGFASDNMEIIVTAEAAEKHKFKGW